MADIVGSAVVESVELEYGVGITSIEEFVGEAVGSIAVELKYEEVDMASLEEFVIDADIMSLVVELYDGINVASLEESVAVAVASMVEFG